MNSMLGLTPEEMEIARKQKYAESLRQQSETPMQGQMVGRTYVPPSWTQGLAKMLSAYGSGRMEREAGDLQKQYGDKQRADLQQIASALIGTPAVMKPVAEGLKGPPQMVTPEQPGNRQAAMAMALKSSNPALQQFALQEAFKTPEGPKWQVQDRYNEKTGKKEKVMVDMNNPNSVMPFGGQEAVERKITSGGTVYDPLEIKPGQTFSDPNKPFNADGTPNLAYQGYETTRARASAPKVVNNISQSTEKKYGEQFAGKVAEADASLMDTAQKAPELAARANRVKQVLKSGKVITGAGADYRLAFAKAAGLVGASDSDTIANTETLASDLSKNTLDAIKASGLGSGNGFSNADRDFLEKAAGGKINFDAKTLGRLADLSYRAASLSAERWNKRAKTIPRSAIEGTGISTAPITLPASAQSGAKFLGFE
jgi:hypothetical protein